MAAATPLLAAESAVPTPKAAAPADTGSWLDHTTFGAYGTVNWEKIMGSGRLGVGIYGQNRIWKNAGIRLSAEAEAWRPNDYFLDRGWADAVLYAPANKYFTLYGVAGFGYAPGRGTKTVLGQTKGRTGEDFLAHAGGGLESALFKLGYVKASAFAQGTLWGTTSDRHGAGLAAGLNIGW